MTQIQQTEETANVPTAYGHIGVLGAGAWGTALAIAAARAGRAVTLCSRNPGNAAGPLPAQIARTTDRDRLLSADAVLAVMPTQQMRHALSGFRPARGRPVVLCMKGIERESGKLVTEVLAETIPDAEPAILSGPSFARDVVQGLPTAVTIAARQLIAQKLQTSLGHAAFRPYASDDVIGVALGGAAKNVYAIACGIVMGLSLGESARAALLARSFAELRRFARAMGARDETLMGLSGLGDLVLTATSQNSRNFAFGFALGEGGSLSALRAPGQPLAEGIETAPALVARASRVGVELPVAETVSDIIAGRIAPAESVPRLMARPLTTE